MATDTTSLWSQIVQTPDRSSPQCWQALDELIKRYWEPVYAYLRHRGRSDTSAADLIKDFFAYVSEGGARERFRRERGRLKTLLLGVPKKFYADQIEEVNHLKRSSILLLLAWTPTH